jgi:hypothetical protein
MSKVTLFLGRRGESAYSRRVEEELKKRNIHYRIKRNFFDDSGLFPKLLVGDKWLEGEAKIRREFFDHLDS